MQADSELPQTGTAEDAVALMLKVTDAGDVLYASETCTDILGVRPGALLNTHVREILHPDGFARARKAVNAAVESGAPWQGSIAFAGSNGDAVILNTSVTPSQLADGTKVSLWYARSSADHGSAITGRVLGRSKHLSLRLRIAAIAAAIVVATALIAVGMLHRMELSTIELQARSLLITEAIGNTRDVQAHFDAQMREWQNMLLRGRDRAVFESYRSSFEREEAIVTQGLATLAARMGGLGLDPAPAKAVASQHRQLGRQLRDAVELYDPAVESSLVAIDRAVEGIERAPADAIDALASRLAAQSDDLLKQAVVVNAEAQLQRALLGGFFLAAIIAISLLMLDRILRRDLKAVGKIVATLSAGNYDEAIDFSRRNEFGEIAKGLKALQVTLAVETNRIAEAALNGRKLQLALHNVNTALMLLDTDHRVVFANAAMHELFAELAADLRQVLPHFAADRIVGESIDTFYTNGRAQRAYLDSIRSNGKQKTAIGTLQFANEADPIFDEEGKRVGTMISWVDVTLENQIAAEVRDIVNAAKQGDFAGRINAKDEDRFLYRLGADINELVDVAEDAIQDSVRVLGAIANGDLTQSIEQEYKGAFGLLKENANATVGRLTEIISGFQSDADTINKTSSEISEGNDNLSTRTERQSVALEQIVASMERLTVTIKQNSVNASQASQLATETRDQAERGSAVVGRAVTAMEQINKSSRTISDIVSVIDDIAFQTNLLALNAAVEAARAGEQGRGFAVVATEVRTLAQRSATAAREIKALISDSVEKVQVGSTLVNESGSMLDAITKSVREVDDFVGQISLAGQDQFLGIQEVGRAIADMEGMTQENATLVVRLAAASRVMNDRASAIDESLDRFQLAPADAERTTQQAVRGSRATASIPVISKVS
ncbi:MAG: methyl-accepting chemotaxis protein [Woeseia sp.]